MSVKLMVDSACDIARDEVVAAGAAFLPLHVRMGEHDYLDGVDLTHEEFYNRLTQGKEQPTTSQISPGFFEEAFRRSLAKGEEVVCLTVSSGLSGTCASALMARDELPLHERGRVHIVDSENVSIGEQVLFRYAMRCLGQGMGASELVEELNMRKQDIRVFALLDTLEYLRRGGRISAVSAAAGTLLNVKPIVAVQAGAIVAVGKARGAKAGRAQLAHLVEGEGGIDLAMPHVAAYSGIDDSAMRDFLRGSAGLFGVDSTDEAGLESIPTSGIGATIGTHVGHGAIGVAFFTKR